MYSKPVVRTSIHDGYALNQRFRRVVRFTFRRSSDTRRKQAGHCGLCNVCVLWIVLAQQAAYLSHSTRTHQPICQCTQPALHEPLIHRHWRGASDRKPRTPARRKQELCSRVHGIHKYKCIHMYSVESPNEVQIHVQTLPPPYSGTRCVSSRVVWGAGLRGMPCATGREESVRSATGHNRGSVRSVTGHSRGREDGRLGWTTYARARV